MLRRIFALMVISIQTFGLSTQIFAQETAQPAAAPKTAAEPLTDEGAEDADIPKLAKTAIGKQRYRELREEQMSFLRGLPYPKQDVRNQAIFETMRFENRLRAQTGERDAAPGIAWRPLGPAPIPNGQTVTRTDPVSGRVAAIAIHPTNPNIVYVGTAQGGLYRTLDGGTTWTPMLDGALSLAIGAVAISPSDPTTIFVGTGEAALSQDAFFGVGIYRITNADSASPVISAPLNRNALNADVFTGRSISKIVVHPTDSNIIFATTSTGTAGLGSATGASAPPVGLYRTNNALAASPTFEKLNVPSPGGASVRIQDAVMDPGDPNRLLVTLLLLADGTGARLDGVYLTTDALAAAPTFTRTLPTLPPPSGNLPRTELAINRVGSTVTVIAASGRDDGTVHRSVDGGVTWAQTIDNNFCNPQCFYDIAVAIDPNDASKVYLGGSPTVPFARSLNGGTAFTTSSVGLHVDTHAISVAPSNPNIIYFGSDGGMWKSLDAGVNWTSLNNSGFSATQFQSLALHPRDRNYLLGGTQDNGTNYFSPSQSWLNSDFGDGGFVAIDSNSASPTSLTAYHTYFNSTNSLIGFTRATATEPNGDPSWGAFFGCNGGTSNNGIACADATLFYAPMVLGPGTPINTLYFGTNKLYRSDNLGTLMVPVSQTLPVAGDRVSAIAISPQNDNVRLIGTVTGKVYATATGATTLTDVTGTIPARYVGRIAVDPNNANTAYVALGGFGLASGQHVYKTTNLNAATPTFAASGVGIPDVPVNALAIDPQDSNRVYAGTDIGVFRSIDGGANWTPFNDGLPRVAVFDMAIQSEFRVLRIATHGRGIWEISVVNSANTRSRADFDGDGRTDFSVFRNGEWYVLRSDNNNLIGLNWGTNGDTIIPGDFDGDRKTDFVVYRPNADENAADAYVLINGSGGFIGLNWGTAGDIPKVADFDNDGKSDLAVYRPSNNTWYVLPTNGSAPTVVSFAAAGQTPVVLDFDGDGRTDLALWNQANGVWTIRNSATGALSTVQWGQSGDRLVPADYDNDNKEDLAIYRGAGQWWIRQSSNGATRIVNFGLSSDVPVPGDYDGDGADDVAVFRNGQWYVQTFNGASQNANFGLSSDKPVPAGYIPQ